MTSWTTYTIKLHRRTTAARQCLLIELDRVRRTSFSPQFSPNLLLHISGNMYIEHGKKDLLTCATKEPAIGLDPKSDLLHHVQLEHISRKNHLH